MLISPDDPNYWFKFERVQRPEIDEGLDSQTRVKKVHKRLGTYKYGDQVSLKMLEEMNMMRLSRDEVKTIDEEARYKGEWSGSQRHGQGE